MKDFLDSILPVVLVGGQSRRFGRNKLREPTSRASEWLVDRPIAALREVFGPRVALVGNCDPDIAARADSVIPDLHPGAGPLGGIISALSFAQGSGHQAVFVLAGDLVGIAASSVLAITQAAAQHPQVLAIVGRADRLQPCVALYRIGILNQLTNCLLSSAHVPALTGVVEALGDRLVQLTLDSSQTANINTQADLSAFRTSST